MDFVVCSDVFTHASTTSHLMVGGPVPVTDTTHPCLDVEPPPSRSHPPCCLFGCWVLFVYCFQMADTDFIWAAFKFPERFLLPWLKRLSCFLQSAFMIGPLYAATGNNCHYQSGLGGATASPVPISALLSILHPYIVMQLIHRKRACLFF